MTLTLIFSITLTLATTLCFFLLYGFKKGQKRILLLEKDNKELHENKSALQGKVTALEHQLESEKKFIEYTTENLKTSFDSLASKALEGNNQHFLNLAKSMFEKESHQAKSELDKKQTHISNLVQPLTQILEKYEIQLSKIEKERQKSYINIENELKKVVQSSESLSSQTEALKNALKKPHVRGRWGEIQLKNCIEISGMSEYSDVNFQDIHSTEDQKLIPDMTVKMPGGRLVVVDAKTPLDAFLCSLEASTEEEKKSQLIRHGKHVKGHVQSLSTKAYGSNVENSADFTVMFLPNESFLYAALETEPDLVEYAIQKKILIATPPTLIGLLKVIRYGWNEERLAENAQKISNAGIELHKRVCDFMEAFYSIGKNLDKAKDEYSKGLIRLESRVLVQAKRLEKLGAKSSKNLPPTKTVDLDTEVEKLEDSTPPLDLT